KFNAHLQKCFLTRQGRVRVFQFTTSRSRIVVDNSSSVQEKFLKYVGQTSPFDPSLEVASAQGMFITDTAGRRYLDFISGFSVTNLGHCHPQVTRAVLEQAQKYAHTSVYGEHVQAPQVELA